MHHLSPPHSGNFFDRLAARVAKADSLLCVGLDLCKGATQLRCCRTPCPHQKELPGGVASVENVEAFCRLGLLG
eukprot:gene39905-2983_t